MKLGRFNGGHVGFLLDDERIVDVSSLLPIPLNAWPPVSTVQAIADFPALHERFEAQRENLPSYPVEEVRLETPIPWPNKLVAFPGNYQSHVNEMKSGHGTAIDRGFFLKASSSLIGPHDEIVLPNLPGYEVHHEAELAIIIGRQGRNIPAENAMDYVFGFACFIDVTIRGKLQEIVMRKSYDTFSPAGPFVVTSDEVPNPHDLKIEFWVDDEKRQDGNTSDLILSIPEMVEMTSSVATLYPGDIFATGTPQGVGPLRGGDTVRISIESIGSMTLPVVQGHDGGNIAFEQHE